MNERDRIINERANIIDIIKRWHCAKAEARLAELKGGEGN